MLDASTDGKIVMLISAMMLLIYGIRGTSYGRSTRHTVTISDDNTELKYDGFFLRLSTQGLEAYQ